MDVLLGCFCGGVFEITIFGVGLSLAIIGPLLDKIRRKKTDTTNEVVS